MDGEIPQQAPHFFTQVDMSLFPEPDYRSFEEVSQLAIANGTVGAYDGLREAVRKFSWMVLTSRRLVEINRYFASHEAGHEQGEIYNDFSALSEYERSLTEFIGYGKASLDGISLFLNAFFRLDEKNQSADLKWAKFRERISDVVPEATVFFAENAEWLDKDVTLTTSIFATRDEWLHRGAPIIPRHYPAQNVGPLPIPRALKLTRAQSMVENDLWTIESFTDHHLSRLRQLLHLSVRTAIAEERKKSPDLVITRMAGPAMFFPLRLTEPTKLTRMLIRMP